MTTSHPGELTGVGLVANRELITRLRSKAWRITVLVMVLIVVGLVIAVHLLRGTSTTTVGFTPQAAPLAAPLRASVAALGSDISTRTVAEQTSGQTEVAAGGLDVLVSFDGAQLRVIVKTSLDPVLHNALTLLAS